MKNWSVEKKNIRLILTIGLLAFTMLAIFTLGGCLKILEAISESLPEPTELRVGFDAQNVNASKDYEYIPAVYSDTKIFDRDNVTFDLYIGGDSRDVPARKFVCAYLRKRGFSKPIPGTDDFRNIEGWTLLKEYATEEYENGERTERVRIGGYYLDMYLTEVTIPSGFFTEERENFYLSVYPIVWSQELDIWQVVFSNSFDLQLAYELLPDNEVKIYETE